MSQNLTLITANRVQMAASSQMMEHIHICYQLYYILDGEPIFIVDDVEIRTHPGSFFYIPPQLPHKMLPLQGSFLCYEFKVQIDDPFLSSHLNCIVQPEEDTGYIRHLLSYVYDNWRSNDIQNIKNTNHILSTLLMGFFLQDLHYIQTDSCRVSTQNYNQLTRAVMAYVERHFQEKFSLHELSQELNYNKNYISSVFTKNTGISIVDYLNLSRIRQAVLMLAFYSQDVFTTCESVGFSNVSHFSRTFKAMTGASPRNFKYVFSKVDRKALHHLFIDEPILALKVCTLEEAFASLRSIGTQVNAFLDGNNLEE